VSAFECPGCGYVYDEAQGNPREGFPAGTAWDAVPDDWCCPDCAVREKVDFQAARGGAPAAAGPDHDHAEAAR
jgi:rubredoxin